MVSYEEYWSWNTNISMTWCLSVSDKCGILHCFQEITTQQMMTHINSVKKDMVILEKSEFSMLRSETEVCTYNSTLW